MTPVQRYAVAITKVAVALQVETPSTEGIELGYRAISYQCSIEDIEKALEILTGTMKFLPRPMDIRVEIQSWQPAAPYHVEVPKERLALPPKEKLLEGYKEGYGNRLAAANAELYQAKIKEVGRRDANRWNDIQRSQVRAGQECEAEVVLGEN